MGDGSGFLASFDLGGGRSGTLVSLPLLERRYGPVSRLPVSLRIVLESMARHLSLASAPGTRTGAPEDGRRIREDDLAALAAWAPTGSRTRELPLHVARVLLQDFTGVPLLVDLASMRSAAARLGRDPAAIEPTVPVDLVVDHSVQVDAWGGLGVMDRNLELEFQRNEQRYRFLKWGMQAFRGLRIIPPGVGICHQVNLEYLARGVFERDGLYFPDTLVGTDSHTTMVNGLGILGWGVGGIEAEAVMLGQPLGLLEPDVVGMVLHGSLREGVTATDLVLTITERLRQAKVVGMFVEFTGPGAATLGVPSRATVANMAPEYGATMGFFPTDEKTLEYLAATGRPPEQVAAVRAYYQAQGLFGLPEPGSVDYTRTLELDLADVEPCVAGPRRPQDRVPLGRLRETLEGMLQPDGGHGRFRPARTPAGPMARFEHEGGSSARYASPDAPPAAAPASYPGLGPEGPADGDVVIAAITSCTNTSNPLVMLAAGLLARKARARGLRPRPWVKTSLAPGSRVVTRYLQQTGLQDDLDALGFVTVGYGCTTCIGNSGPLDPRLEAQVAANRRVVASVLSGNRNFEARIHSAVRANFLMSPPLVVAFALAGTVAVDLGREPLGHAPDGAPVFLADIWPSLAEVEGLLAGSVAPGDFAANYAHAQEGTPAWAGLEAPAGTVYPWDEHSTYIAQAPWIDPSATASAALPVLAGARALAILGDSVTTDHISPAGAISPDSPAGQWLLARGVAESDFNSYGSRRGQHEVMVRGTFANVRVRNLMLPGEEGGFTRHQPSGGRLTIHAAAERYQSEGVPLLVLAGQDYGTGSSRDWAAKGTRLLGVRAVVACSFERIHRSNLVGMGVLPLQFDAGTSPASLHLDGSESYDLEWPGGQLAPGARAVLRIHRGAGGTEAVPVLARIDTPLELDWFRRGGVLPYVFGQIQGKPGGD